MDSVLIPITELEHQLSSIPVCSPCYGYKGCLAFANYDRSVLIEFMRHHTPTLLAIISYKILTTILLAGVAIALGFTVKRYDALQNWAEELLLADRQGFVAWGIEHMAQLKPRTLIFSSLVAGVYSGLSATEAVGLWYRKIWAHWLVLVMIFLGIPPEIYELHHSFSILKLVVFLLNVGIFLYLWRNFPKSAHR